MSEVLLLSFFSSLALTAATVLGVVVALVLVLFTLAGLPNAKERAIADLPAPEKTLPVVGNTFEIMFEQLPRLHDWFTEQCKRHNGKHWRLKMLGTPPSVVLCSSQAFEDVTRNLFDHFGKGQRMAEIFQEIFGEGIFAVDGAKWFHQRKTASHLFALPKLKSKMEKVVMEKTELFCAKLAEMVSANGIAEQKTKVAEKQKEVFEGPATTVEQPDANAAESTSGGGGTEDGAETFDLAQLMARFTLDVFTKIGFGVEMHALENNLDQSFTTALKQTASTLENRFHQPMWLWKIKRWLGVGMEGEYKKSMSLINNWVFGIVTKSLQLHNENTANSDSDKPAKPHRLEDEDDLISLFLTHVPKIQHGKEDEAAQAQVHKVDAVAIRDMTMNFVLAGRDTTALTMSWMVVNLNRHPRVLTKIRRELAEKLPELTTGQLQVPSMEQVANLTYLEAVAKETLRLYPTIPLNSKMVLKDVTLTDGTVLKKGTRVSIPVYAFGRLTSAWGEDAEQFVPERWLDASNKLLPVSPFKFISFNAGPRQCLGMRLALMEIKIAMASLLSKFDLPIVNRDPKAISYELSLSLRIKGPVRIQPKRFDWATVSQLPVQSVASSA